VNPFVIIKWTKGKLRGTPENLDFEWAKDWPLDHLRTIAWHWEIERELGSGNPPFIIAWKKSNGEKMPVAPTVEPAAQFIPFRDVQKLYAFDPEFNYHNGSFPTTYHAVKIDLRRTPEEILNDLKRGIKHFKSCSSSLEHRPKRGVQRRDLLAWFRDLGIYRMSVAGIRTKDQMNLLQSSISALDFQNWNHKRDFTIKRIQNRLQVLRWSAKILSEDGNLRGSSDWRDHFTTLDDW